MTQQNIKLEENEKSLKCRRCGRKLKNPESIEIGFGVICYQKYQNRKKLIPLFTIPKQEETNEMDEKTAKELASKTQKIKRLETRVTNLKKSNTVKDVVIKKLVEKLIPDGDGAIVHRKALVIHLTKEAKENT